MQVYPRLFLRGDLQSGQRQGPYEAGQSFSESPGDRHGVSANASETKPANETELTIPFGNRKFNTMR
jgi:hypothetical protein